jgi:peptidoglycan/xylan/chitin deacetylase (PgdA/CDA1 family)
VEELTIDGHCFKRSASYNYVDQGLQTNLHEFLKQLPAIRRDHLLEEMRKGYESHKKLRHEDEVSFKLMNSGQIRELAATDQIEIGSHAHAHYCLANVDELTVQRELMLSKQLLEEVAGKEVVSIAYPDSSYTETIKEQSLIAGYQNLLAVKYQLPQDVDDLSILPRHGLSPTTNFYSNIFFLHNAFKYTGF